MTCREIIETAIEYWMDDGDIDMHLFITQKGVCHIAYIEIGDNDLRIRSFENEFSAARYCLYRLIKQRYFETRGDIDMEEALKFVGLDGEQFV